MRVKFFPNCARSWFRFASRALRRKSRSSDPQESLLREAYRGTLGPSGGSEVLAPLEWLSSPLREKSHVGSESRGRRAGPRERCFVSKRTKRPSQFAHLVHLAPRARRAKRGEAFESDEQRPRDRMPVRPRGRGAWGALLYFRLLFAFVKSSKVDGRMGLPTQSRSRSPKRP